MQSMEPTKFNYILLILLLGVIPLSKAVAERGESIMFEPKEHPFTEAPQEKSGEAEQCTELAKRIESLKGKPQHRHAALERYRLTCSDKTLLE